MLDRADANVLTAIYRGTQERVIEGTLGSLLNVELGSGTAQQLRAECEREERQALADQNAVENKLRALNQLLDRSENGEAGAWLSIWDSVLVAKWPGVPSWGGASRLDQLACWVYFDNVTRERLYLAAQRYLLIGARPALELFSQTGWPSWVSAEFSALLNTFERFPAGLLPVDNTLWQRWCRLALWYAFEGSDERDRAFRGFLAQRLQPFVAAAEQVLNFHIAQKRRYSIAEGLRFDWTPEIARFVLDQTRRIDLENSCWDELSALGLAEAPELFEEYLWENLAGWADTLVLGEMNA